MRKIIAPSQKRLCIEYLVDWLDGQVGEKSLKTDVSAETRLSRPRVYSGTKTGQFVGLHCSVKWPHCVMKTCQLPSLRGVVPFISLMSAVNSTVTNSQLLFFRLSDVAESVH